MDYTKTKIETLHFRSPFPKKKEEEQNAKIKEMKSQGWDFIEAQSVKSMKSANNLGGAVELTFKQ